MKHAGTVMFRGVGQVEEGGEWGGGENMPEQLCFGEWDRWRREESGGWGENMPEQLCFGEWDRWRRGGGRGEPLSLPVKVP